MDPVSRVIRISRAPSEKEAFESWLRMDDAIAFLNENAIENEFVVYAATGHTFTHAVLVPSALVTPPDIEDLTRWSCNPSSSWGVEIVFSQPHQASIVPPLSNTGCKTLNSGEQLVFFRSFDGRVGDKHYYEVLQKFTHSFDLHFIESRNAYCRLDKHGDVEDVIRIVDVPSRGNDYGGTIITFNRALLDEYLVLTDSTIVRTFDFTRYRPSHFGGWSRTHGTEYSQAPELFYRSHTEPGHASYMRGCQIVRSMATKEAIIKRHDFSEPEEREYASFIAYDWKNRVVREISCAPGQTANYFTESNLPFELSPAFFKPEVLSKYKADSDKYRLKERSISCRGTWHLETYDINEDGQVHTYIVYLRNLPYEEQLYWKSCNEKPKGSLSKRAIETDFKGNWYLEYDPLNSLKGLINNWDHAQVPWWMLRSEKLADQLHYPVTSSHDEWADEILHLDQLVVEGFDVKWLRSTAQQLGRTPALTLKSLGLVEACLIGLGYAEDDAHKIVAPLKQVHHLRSKLKGHASGGEAVTIRKQALADYRSYKKHFRELTEAVDQSARAIEGALRKFPSEPEPLRPNGREDQK